MKSSKDATQSLFTYNIQSLKVPATTHSQNKTQYNEKLLSSNPPC